MAETETSAETSVSKTIANILKAVREQPKQPKPEEISKVVERIYSDKTKIPDVKQTRIGRIIENAKRVVAEAKTQGVHVSTGLHEWVGRNKLPVLDENPAQAFKIAKADLAVAINASDLPEDHWVVRAATRVQNAESAQTLAIIALAPKEVRDNPNFVFQTAAQLAGSNIDPETQVTTKAFVAELKNLRGVDGFEMGDNELSQALTETGLGAMPAPTSDNFGAPSGPDFSTLPDPIRHLFQALNEEYQAVDVSFPVHPGNKVEEQQNKYEKLRVFVKYDTQIGLLDPSGLGLSKDQYRILTDVLQEKQRLEQRVAITNTISRDRVREISGVIQYKPDPILTKMSMGDVETMLTPAKDGKRAGVYEIYERLADRVFTSGEEAHQPDIYDQYEYSEFEHILREVWGENNAIINEFRRRWNVDYPRNAVVTRAMSGYGTEKEYIDLKRSIQPDTLHYETHVQHAPEAIAIQEAAFIEIANEHRYKYDRDTEYVTQLTTKYDGKRQLNRSEVWNKYPNDRAVNFPGREYKKMVDAVQSAHGVMVEDAWLVPNAPEFVQLTSLTRAIEAEITQNAVIAGGLTEDQIVAKYKDRLQILWKRVTLWNNPPEGKPFNPKYIEKTRGFSPLEMRTLDTLEAQLRLQTGQEPVDWELRTAVLAARRYMVGSQWLLALDGALSNMPALEITPTGGDVMPESMEYGMRTEQAERYVLMRFGMGKVSIGQRIMAEAEINLFRLRGVTLGNTPLKRSISEGESMPMRRYRTVHDKAKNAYGVGFGQLVVGTILDSNCPFVYGTWRSQKAITEVLDAKHGPSARHLALGIRLRMTETGEGKTDKKDIAKEMAKRAPFIQDIEKRELSIPFLYLGTKEFDEKVLKKNHMVPGAPQYHRFLKVLGLAERKIFTKPVYFKDDNFDIVNKTYFNKVFTTEVFQACGVSNGTEIQQLKDKYYKVLLDTRRFFVTKQKGQSMSSSKMWEKEGFQMTLSMRDFSLSEADFKRIQNSAQMRGDVGDPMSRLEARNDLIGTIADQDISMPEDVKKTLIPAIKKIDKDINAYKSPHFSEQRAALVTDAVLSQLSAKDTYRGIVQLLPFVPALMRGLVGVDMSKPWIQVVTAPARWLVKGYTTFMGQKELQELLDHDIKEWPQIFGQEFISGAAGVKGGKFTTPMAIDMNGIIDDIEHAGIFGEHSFLHGLRDKYKTRIGYRMGEGFLRYWWVPFAAAITVGVIIAMKEQGLDEHK